mmetsp:Transcript_5426/g.11190  ORF Transcript_5426/g.11190 Transcript_5426/m.11190 type:complete len:153 (+) Transcript_5426:1131-1589(+)
MRLRVSTCGFDNEMDSNERRSRERRKAFSEFGRRRRQTIRKSDITELILKMASGVGRKVTRREGAEPRFRLLRFGSKAAQRISGSEGKVKVLDERVKRMEFRNEIASSILTRAIEAVEWIFADFISDCISSKIKKRLYFCEKIQIIFFATKF